MYESFTIPVRVLLYATVEGVFQTSSRGPAVKPVAAASATTDEMRLTGTFSEISFPSDADGSPSPTRLARTWLIGMFTENTPGACNAGRGTE